MDYQGFVKKIKQLKKFRWKVILYFLFVVSIVLIGQTLFCYLQPDKYPTNNVEECLSFRSIEDFPIEQIEDYYYSSVIFENCSIKIKQEITANLENFNEVEMNWVCEARLVDKNYSYGIVPWIILKPNTELYNLELSINSQNAKFYVHEIDGKKQYQIPGFNLTEYNEVTQFKMHYTVSHSPYPDGLVKIPLIFNENYATSINFPIFSLSLHHDDVSDINTFQTNFNIPFREILVEHSGWMDFHVQPESEWIESGSDEKYVAIGFQYPIEQETDKYGNTYSFSTYFSKNNIANKVTLVTIPNLSVIVFLLLFLSAPFYIPIIDFIKNKLNRSSKIQPNLVLKAITLFFQLYFGPLTMMISLILGGALSVEFLSYLIGITILNFVGLILLILYPLLFTFLFYKAKE